MVDHPELDDRQQRFLRAMLRLDPSRWAWDVIAELEVFRNISEQRDSSHTVPPTHYEIKEILDLFINCRRYFWKGLADPWIDKLRTRNFDKFPELQPAAQRLLRWYRVQPQLLQLAKKMSKDSLAAKLMAMATMSAREIASLKVELFERKPKWFGPNYRRQAKWIKRNYPELYALDPEWFDELCFWPKLQY